MAESREQELDGGFIARRSPFCVFVWTPASLFRQCLSLLLYPTVVVGKMMHSHPRRVYPRCSPSSEMTVVGMLVEPYQGVRDFFSIFHFLVVLECPFSLDLSTQ